MDGNKLLLVGGIFIVALTVMVVVVKPAYEKK